MKFITFTTAIIISLASTTMTTEAQSNPSNTKCSASCAPVQSIITPCANDLSSSISNSLSGSVNNKDAELENKLYTGLQKCICQDR